MDPRYGPAWVAFGHTFALEGEHDHAVTAYSTCARMFTGYVVSPSVYTIRLTLCIQLSPSIDVHWNGTNHAFQLRFGR